jgi:hypothetical protein
VLKSPLEMGNHYERVNMANNGSGLSAADRNRRIRQEALREQLSNKGLVQQVIEINTKMADLASDLPPEHVTRLKIAMDVNLKLVAKYLPDLKQTELIGDPEQPVEHNHTVGWVLEGVKPNVN